MEAYAGPAALILAIALIGFVWWRGFVAGVQYERLEAQLRLGKGD